MNRLHFSFSVLVLVFGAAIARAWIPLTGEVWPDGTVTVQYTATPVAPTGSNWDAALREAATAWNRDLQRIQLAVGPAADSPPTTGNDRSEIYFDRMLNGEQFPSGVLAATLTIYTRGVHTESDIAFNANLAWSVYNGAIRNSPYDFRRVAIHELGHSLGLDHPDENGQSVSAIMNSHVSNIETPTADDQTGVHALYDLGNGGAPVIITQPVGTTAKQGTAVTFTVSAGGRGPLHYEWRRNGTPVPAAADRSTLKLTVALDDGGDYTVTIQNAGGSVTSQIAQLVVLPAEAPTVSIFTDRASLAAGSDLTLNTSTRGDSPLTYVWRRNGIVIAGATSTALTLHDIQFSDAGDYTFTATNIAGQATTTPFHLQVSAGQPPRIIGDLPSAAAVAPGDRLDVGIAVVASSPVRYQWRRNGIDLPDNTSQQLAVVGFKSSDQGIYTVAITNPFGQVMSSAMDVTMYQIGGYGIARQPAAVTGYAGSDVYFEVGMQQPVTTWTWFKNGVPIPDPSGGRSPPRSRLTLSRITTVDAGIYSVEVSDGVNRARSIGARLSMATGALPLIVEHPATYTVVSGAAVNLNVRTREPANCDWYKDGVRLASGTSLSLTASSATTGRYFARVSTAIETVDSDVAEVALVPAPGYFAAHPTSRAYEVGLEELRLTGVVDEVAQRRAQRDNLLYVYRRDGVEVDSPYKSFQSGTYTLTLGPASAPETSRPFRLSFVSSGPVITRHPAGAGVVLGDAVELSVELAVPGAPDLRFQWLKDGAVLPNGAKDRFFISGFSTSDVGSYTVSVQNAKGTTVSEPATLEFRGPEIPLITAQPADVVVEENEGGSVFVGVRRNDLRIQWQKNGVNVPGATDRTLSFASAGAAGSYAATVTDGVRTVTSRAARVQVLAANRAPTIPFPPVSGTGILGGAFEFAVGADGKPLPDRYQWRRNGVDIPGANDAKLKIAALQPGDVGIYTVVVTNANGSIVSPPATLTLDDRARLVNLATRATVGTGGDVLVAGFVASGTQSRSLLVRAIGEQLIDFGVAGAMRDPVLTIFDSKAKQLATNDDWFRTGEDEMTRLENAAKQVGAFAQNREAHDAALIIDLAPGAYSAQVSGFSNATGVALIEIYELGAPSNNRLINLSTRARVGQGANLLIPGLVLSGRSARTLLVRAVGPSLADFGVSGPLADPKLTIFNRDNEKVAENDNWSDQPSASALASAMQTVGAFALKSGTRDAAVILNLPPGPYTIQVSGVGDTSGTALVEVYEVPSP